MAVVIQIDGYDPIGGLPVTLRAGSVDDPRVCHLGDMLWWPAIAKLPTLRYDLFDGSFSAQITAPTSSLTVQTEQWPDFGRYALANARLRLWTGSAGTDWPAWTLRFDGRITAQPKLAGGVASIDFAVDDSWLDAALLATYAGTTGVEGPAELKGQAKPLALGAPRYVAGKLIDSVNTVFQVSAYGAIGGVEAALEKLARFSPPVGDRPSYASLVAADIPAGRWATCRAAGLVRFGAPTEGLISFLVQGDIAGSDAWARRPGQLIRRLAILSGGAGRIDDASLDALDAVRPYNLSVYVEEQTTARDLIQRIAASVNAVAGVSWTGKLFVVPIGLAPASLTLSADGSTLPPVRSIEQIAIEAPWQKLAIGAERAWTVHALSDIAFTAPLVDVGAYDPATTYREGNLVSLPDGSRWLYVGTTPAAGHPPAASDPDRWSNLNPATKAGDITYDDGKTLEDLKPAEPGATDGATLGGNVKNGAGQIINPAEVLNSALSLQTDGTLIATVDGATRVLGKLKLPDMNAASDAARRQLENDLASLSAAVAQLAAGQQIVQNVFRDAGLYTDSKSGVAKLFAVESRAEQIAKLSVTLNAALATIDLKASVNFVNQAILQAQLGGASADLSSIFVRLTSAETVLSGLQASIQLKADATIVTGLQGSVTSIQQSLDALNATIASKASQTVVDNLGQRLTIAEQVLNAFDGASITNSVTAARRAPADADAAGANSILALLGGHNALTGALTAIATAKTELRALTDSNTSAIASMATTLGVQIGAVTALYGSEQQARIDGDIAISSDLTTYKTQTNGSLATINQILTTQSGINTAVSGTLTSLSTTVGGHTSTLNVYGESIDGLRAKWGVEFNVNGAVTGFALNNGSGRTDATFVVNTFKIAQPDGKNARVVFSIADDGVVEMTSVRVGFLKAKSVTADNIVPGAVLRLSVQVLESPVTVSWG